MTSMLRHRRAGIAGFTLIELMLTITIAAILLGLAAPSFVTFKRNSELTSATNSLVGALSIARGEALKIGQNVVVIPASGSDWNSGVTVFVDANSNLALNTGERIVFQQAASPSYITVSGAGAGAGGSLPYVMFDPSGYSRTSAATYQSATLTLARSDVSSGQQPEQTRVIVIAKTGRVRACKPASSSDTTCTANSTE